MRLPLKSRGVLREVQQTWLADCFLTLHLSTAEKVLSMFNFSHAPSSNYNQVKKSLPCPLNQLAATIFFMMVMLILVIFLSDSDKPVRHCKSLRDKDINVCSRNLFSHTVD